MPDLDPNGDDFYDLVVVGRGYSASTYLFTADLTWCRKILIIGGPDSWEHVVRGDGVVNHASYIFARQAATIGENPAEDGHEEPSPRAVLRDENAAIITQAMNWLNAEDPQRATDIKGITQSIDRQSFTLTQPITVNGRQLVAGQRPFEAYRVTYQKWTQLPGETWQDVATDGDPITVSAMKVVYCGGGAGPHDDTPYARNRPYYDRRKFLDLDSFIRVNQQAEDPGNTKLVLLGGNAGVDAAVAALSRNYKLYWLISGAPGTQPLWLSTKHYQINNTTGQEAIELANSCIVNYDKNVRPEIDCIHAVNEQGDDVQTGDFTVNMTNQVYRMGWPDDTFTSITAQYVVYAIGQNPNAEERSSPNNIVSRIGPARVLRPLLQREKLTPIYDVNQRFGNPTATALALRDSNQGPYTGLEVFGAAALALAGANRGANVKQAFFADSGDALREVDNLAQPNASTAEISMAVNNVSAFEQRRALRIAFDLEEMDTIPSVTQSMVAILPKLYAQTLLAADQLAVINSQITAVNGFDLISAITAYADRGNSVGDLRRAAEQLKQAILAARRDNNAGDIGPKRGTFLDHVNGFAPVDEADNGQVGAYFNLLPADERQALTNEGFIADQFAQTLNDAFLAARAAALGSPQFQQAPDLTNMEWQQGVLQALPRLQKWLTNYEAIIQTGRVNQNRDPLILNSADQTQMAVLLAASYPAIPVDDWPRIVTLIQNARQAPPWGYDSARSQRVFEWLSQVNQGQRTLAQFPL